MAIQIKSSSAEDLKKLQDARAQREAEQAANGGFNRGSGKFTPTPGTERRAYVQTTKGSWNNKVVTNKPGIFRFVNLDIFPQKPASQWNLHNGEARLLHDAWIVDDNGKKMHLIYPIVDDDTKSVYGDDHNPINEFIEAVLEEQKTWITVEVDGKKKKKLKKTPLYAERNDHGNLEGTPEAEGLPTIKQIYQYILKGGDDSQMSKGFEGTKVCICNCIDRSDMDYHKSAKKFKLFAQSVSLDDPTKPRFKDPGKFFLYDPLYEAIPEMSFDGDYNRVDVAVIPEKAAFGNNAFQARVLEASARVKSGFTNDLKAAGFTPEQLSQVVVDDYLSDEELSWDPVDIDAAYPLTSCNAFAKRLGKTVDAWDKMMGTNFLARMKAIAEKELAAKANEKEETTARPSPAPMAEASEPLPPPAPIDDGPDPYESVAAARPQSRPVARPTTAAPSSDLDFSNLKGYPLLTAEELALIDVEGMKAARGTADNDKYFDADGKVKTLKFVASAEPLYSCENLGPNADEGCGNLNPLAFTHCAYCGYDYTKQ